MKVKELIAELQRLDPTGELFLDGVASVDRLPGYYDGAGTQIILDLNWNYSFHVTDKVDKIRITTYSLEDAVWDEATITSDLDEVRMSYFEQHLRKAQQEYSRVTNEMKKIYEVFP